VTAPAAAPTGAAAGYARLRPGGGGAAVRGHAALIWVEGPDAAGFLHGLLSNDVEGLTPGGATRALLLDAKGHVQADLRVWRDAADAFTLVLPPGAGALVAELLDRYHFSEDLELLGPEEVETVTLPSRAPRVAASAEPVVPSVLAGAVEAVVDDAGAAIAASGLPEAPAAALEMARVAAGAALVGLDTGPTTLVQEAGLEDEAVSFEKGCYLGQETVARVQYRGRVNRALRGLRLSAAAPTAGGRVLLEGREVGRMTSAADTPDLGSIGLAVLRREAQPGADVEVEAGDGSGPAVPARVVELPFAAA
jgi:tRNA-modifying protein YgfZ